MNELERIISDLHKRVKALEDATTVRYRTGVVSDTGPLDIKLGGSDTAFEDVRAVAGAQLAADDTVAVLTMGNDLIVLGKITSAPTIATGTSTVTFTAATNSAAKTISHGLGATPSYLNAFAVGDTGVKGIHFDCIDTPDSTSFDVVGYCPTSLSATITFVWIAIA